MKTQNGRQAVFLDLLENFSEWMERLNYAKKSVKERTRQLNVFLEWLEKSGIKKLTDLQQKDLEKYNKWLHQKPLRSKTILGYIGALKLCNQYLENHGEAPVLTAKLQIEKDIEIPKNILSKSQINLLYESCGSDLFGLRDRAIIALFYGCGLRCKEGANIEQKDINFETKLIHVRKGKGYKERYVPMSKGVSRELEEWLAGGHKYFTEKSNLIIPSRTGKIIGCHGLTKRIKLLCRKSNINKETSLHGLRHSIATHLLESGMSLEQIGQFLGHSSLESTQIYTRVKDGI